MSRIRRGGVGILNTLEGKIWGLPRELCCFTEFAVRSIQASDRLFDRCLWSVGHPIAMLSAGQAIPLQTPNPKN